MSDYLTERRKNFSKESLPQINQNSTNDKTDRNLKVSVIKNNSGYY